MNRVYEWGKQYTWVIKPVLFLWGLYTVAMTSVIRANVYYADDMWRAQYGVSGWYDWGRYINEILSPLIHTSKRLDDISPLTLYIALLIGAVASVVLVCAITRETKISFIQLVAVTPLVLNPCFLQCLSYKYDAPYMTLAVLFGVLPFLFLRWDEITDNTIRGFLKRDGFFLIVAAVSTLCMCMCHQAASGIFPMMTVFMVLQKFYYYKKIGGGGGQRLSFLHNGFCYCLYGRAFAVYASASTVSGQKPG